MSTIPVSEVVNVTPAVLPAGGSAIDIVGLILTTSTRPPIGSVLSFASQAAVSSFFGPTSAEAQNATVYFAGFNNSNKKPGALQFTQYPAAAVAAYLRGGNISALTLTQLQALSGTLNVTVNGVVKSGSPNLATATSFSNGGSIIGKALGISGQQQGSFTGVVSTTTLTVSGYTATNGGALGVGSVISGGTIAAGTYITALGTGTGGNGTYTIDTSQTVSSASMTGNAPAVTYDTVSGGYTIASGTTGAASTIGFGSGTLATSLLLTQALGAVTSQGAAAATPAGFMNALVQNSRSWSLFMLNFNPDTVGVITNRLAFAAWADGQSNRLGYVAIDDDATPTTTVPASASLAQQIATAGYDGTNVNWQQATLAGTNNYGDLAAFVMGTAASIDFSQTNGRTTFKFRQGSVTPSVTDQVTFDNLVANGYNNYGAYAEGAQAWQWYANGIVSGPFAWMDSFVNQLWLNAGFRSDLVNLLQNTPSIPYNAAGRATIQAGLSDRINQGLNFGAYRTGVTLSASQIASVNASAGKNIADTLTNQGWYLLVGDASPSVRQARQSPPVTFYYVDGEAVQQINMTSVELQ